MPNNPVYDLPADVEWPKQVKPQDWRNIKEDDESDDDENVPTPNYVKEVLGFDPDEI